MVPTGTILVFALMRMPIQVNSEMLTKYGLTEEAAAAASAFLKTGEVVTTDGEMNPTDTVVESLASDTPNPRIVQPLSTNEIKEVFKREFPNVPAPSVEICEKLDDYADHDISVIEDMAVLLKHGRTQPKGSLHGLLLWIMKNYPNVEDVRETADHHRNAKKSTKDVISEVLLKAEQQIKKLPKPEANQKVVDDLDTLLGELDG